MIDCIADPERDDFYKDEMARTQKNIEMINKEFVNTSNNFATNDSVSFNISHFLGKAFVSFELQHYRNFFLR